MTPSWIECGAGRLFAIVHEPAARTDNGCTIIMPSAGQDSRIGPQRIYLRAARRFAAEGFRVVRADLSGTGDSATPNPRIHLDSHSTDDVKAVVNWVQATWAGSRIYLVALCAGARVAFRYAAHDDRIAGVVAWSVPTLSEGDTPYLNVQGMRRAFTSKRLLTAAWWKKRFKHGFREIRTVATTLFDGACEKLGMKRESWFIRCMDKYLRDGRPARFMFGSLDKVLCEEFAQRFPEVSGDATANQSFSIIPEGVHTLATLEAQQLAISQSVEWLSHQVAADAYATIAADVDAGSRNADHRAA